MAEEIWQIQLALDDLLKRDGAYSWIDIAGYSSADRSRREVLADRSVVLGARQRGTSCSNRVDIIGLASTGSELTVTGGCRPGRPYRLFVTLPNRCACCCRKWLASKTVDIARELLTEQ